jgi:hypothetical protein
LLHIWKRSFNWRPFLLRSERCLCSLGMKVCVILANCDINNLLMFIEVRKMKCEHLRQGSHLMIITKWQSWLNWRKACSRN